MTPRAIGCSLARSSPAARKSTSCSLQGAMTKTLSSAGWPRVSVPVLSSTRVSISRSASTALASRKSTPSCAPRPLETMIEIGVASPKAQGHAMINTATALTSAYARRGSGPRIHQVTKVSNAITMTAGTNQAATLSANRCSGARERCAWATSATIRESTPCALGSKTQQLPDCATRSSARPEFEPFTQKHECDDRGGDFEVHADHAVFIAHSGWKYLWRKRRDEAVRIGDEYAEADQGVHV